MQAWQPKASIAVLKKRARFLQMIREFFSARDVLEVETPLLSTTSVTDPHLESIPALFQIKGARQSTLYLQTSPEYAMKRLLAAGSGPIYQICKAFRQGDLGKIHHPEFTLLEWYRPGFNHHDLMNEMDELLQLILKTQPAERLSYSALFEKYSGINPHTITQEKLIDCIHQHSIHFIHSKESDRDTLLSLLLTHHIEPQIGQDHPLFLYDFPVTQAALAKIRANETPPVASRFEVYFKGIELANGFHELQSATEQRARFMKDLAYRTQHHLPVLSLDEKFLAALDAGLPDCSGVALGIDRLVMLALEKEKVEDVISFLSC